MGPPAPIAQRRYDGAIQASLFDHRTSLPREHGGGARTQHGQRSAAASLAASPRTAVRGFARNLCRVHESFLVIRLFFSPRPCTQGRGEQEAPSSIRAPTHLCKI